MTTPKRWGAEFVLNTTTTSDQSLPAITALADGRFVATWEDHSQTGEDASGVAIRARLFDADGGPSGAEFLVNSTTAASQSQPAVTALADGGFVAVWTDESATGGDTSEAAVRAQVFDADGARSGGEVLVNSATGDWQYQPAVAALADGRFLVGWSDYSQSGGDTSAWAVRARLFDADGAPAGDELLVNSTTPAGQSRPAIASLADGRFVVAWQDTSATGGDTSGSAVRGQIFDPRLAEVRLNGTFADDAFMGTVFGDWISGSVGRDKLRGGAGDDRLRGQEGDDRLFGQDGHDELLGGGGGDTLSGGAGDDRLKGGLGDDTYVLASGDMVLEGSDGGTDRVKAGVSHVLGANVEKLLLQGDDPLIGKGNALANAVRGNAGANTLLGLEGDDRLDGGAGADRLKGGAGRDRLQGDSGEDKLWGRSGDDRLDGDAGADSLHAGGGRDRLHGDLGRDKLYGGTDSSGDDFVFTSRRDSAVGASRDTVHNFTRGSDDVDLRAVDARASTAGTNENFKWAGERPAAHSVWWKATDDGVLLRADVTGDSTADFEVLLTELVSFGSEDVLL